MRFGLTLSLCILLAGCASGDGASPFKSADPFEKVMAEQPALGKTTSELTAMVGEPATIIQGPAHASVPNPPSAWVYRSEPGVVTVYQITSEIVEAVNVINIYRSEADQLRAYDAMVETYNLRNVEMIPVAGLTGAQEVMEATGSHAVFRVGYYTHEPGGGGRSFDFGPPATPPSRRTSSLWILKQPNGEVPPIFWVNS